MLQITQFLNSVNLGQGLLFVSIRVIIIYALFVVIFRFANNRFQLQTPFDFIMPIILGSVLGRSINGSTSLISGLTASIILIFLHWLFAVFAFHSQSFGNLVKGSDKIIIENGVLDLETMRKNQITENDVLAQLRQHMHRGDLSCVREARIERNGIITFILK